MPLPYRPGSYVEVLVPEIHPTRGVIPRWDTATFVEVTITGYIMVKIKDAHGDVVLRVFSPDDVRASRKR